MQKLQFAVHMAKQICTGEKPFCLVQAMGIGTADSDRVKQGKWV